MLGEERKKLYGEIGKLKNMINILIDEREEQRNLKVKANCTIDVLRLKVKEQQEELQRQEENHALEVQLNHDKDELMREVADELEKSLETIFSNERIIIYNAIKKLKGE